MIQEIPRRKGWFRLFSLIRDSAFASFGIQVSEKDSPNAWTSARNGYICRYLSWHYSHGAESFRRLSSLFQPSATSTLFLRWVVMVVVLGVRGLDCWISWSAIRNILRVPMCVCGCVYACACKCVGVCLASPTGLSLRLAETPEVEVRRVRNSATLRSL